VGCANFAKEKSNRLTQQKRKNNMTAITSPSRTPPRRTETSEQHQRHRQREKKKSAESSRATHRNPHRMMTEKAIK
jgi:hypothetical protein